MYKGIFDSHAHYDDRRFDADRYELLNRLFAGEVCAVMNAGSDMRTSRFSVKLAEKYPGIFCAVGIHPHDAKSAKETDYAELAEMAKLPKVVALGEMGLDYHYDFSPREIQREVFARQLELAVELDMPVVIHDREAHADVMELLKKYRPKGVMHCFSGSAESARELVKLGFYVGFTGVVTFKNARRALEAAAVVPDDRLLIETDCPYMAPEPHRSERNDSGYLGIIAEKLAEIRSTTAQGIIDQTRKNACELFGIDEKTLKLG